MVSVTLLDMVILGFLVVVMIVSARRGMGETACALVGDLLALLAAILCAGTLTGALISGLKVSAGASLEAQLGLMLPKSVSNLGAEAMGTVLHALERSVLRPLVFAIAFPSVLVLWQYACLHFGLMDRFPRSRRFDQLYGALLGLLKAVVLAAAAVYVLASLGVISAAQIQNSLLLGRVVALWNGRM